MNSFLFGNLLAWSAQVSILVIVAAAAVYALRQPRARLYFWQAILAVSLLLPLLTPWKETISVPAATTVSLPLATQAVAAPPDTPTPLHFDPLLVLLAAGAALRLAWVGVGLLRLAFIRKSGQVMQQPPVAFGGSARWYVSDEVSGPVTFGWLRPTILLPKKMLELPAGAQEAIASHELFHVHRRDWLFVMAEELIRSVLWFHPAIWFVLSRIQLAREQVVDQEVVHATRDRAGYLEALVAVAAQRLLPDVAPAPLFLKKRQLAVRVQALLKETSMSASRLTAHVSVATSAAVLGAFAAVWLFPLRSAAQVVPDDPGITVDAGATLAHRAPVHFPRGTIVTGDVLLELTLDSKGEVADARVLSGPEELRKAALASVLEWHYLADTAPSSVIHATIHFGQRLASDAPPPPPPPPPPGAGGRGGRGAQAPSQMKTAVVQRIDYSAGLNPELQQRIMNRLTVRIGDTPDPAQLSSELQGIDEHLRFNYTLICPCDAERANVILSIMLQQGVETRLPVVSAALPPGVYRIGGGVSAPVPISRAEPEYTEQARAAKWQGAVLLQVTVDENGVPQNIQVIRPLGMGLDQKAIEAVQKWRFKPGTKDGQPVPVLANIEVNFRLLQSPELGPGAPPVPGAVAVGSAVMEGRLIQKVPPEYPPTARIARIQGTVQINLLVGTDGKVENVQAISGPAMLTQAAMEAVRQWVYQPYLLNGQPVTVQTTATVNFVLQ